MAKIQRISNPEEQGREYINYSRQPYSKSRSRSVRRRKNSKHEDEFGERDFTARRGFPSSRESTAEKMARKEKERLEKLEELKQAVCPV